MENISATEFIMWAEHMSRNRRHPIEYYMARLTAEIVVFRKMFADSASVSVKVSDYMIGEEYVPVKPEMATKKIKVKMKKTAKQVTDGVKKIFAIAFGFNPEEKK